MQNIPTFKTRNQKENMLFNFIEHEGYSDMQIVDVLYLALFDDNSEVVSPPKLSRIRIAWTLIKCGCEYKEGAWSHTNISNWATFSLNEMFFHIFKPIRKYYEKP